MKAAAVIVGIDNYVNHPLSSAVNDARAFQQALIDLNLADPGEIILLTAPLNGSREQATKGNICDTLYEFYDKGGDYQRFFFFYAGHGLLTFSDEARGLVRNTLMPVDVKDLDRHGRNLLDLDELRERFLFNGPQEQYFFIDACRDLTYESYPSVGNLGWGGGKPLGMQRRQATLFAVAPLGKAQATKGGLGRMTSHMLEALGSNRLAVEFQEDSGDWVISMRSLADYVKEAVKKTIQNEPQYKRIFLLPQLDTTDPEPSPLRTVAQPDPVHLTVHIQPEEAAADTRVTISLRGHALDDRSLPPRRNHDVIPLTPQRHLIRAASTLGPVAPERCAVDLRLVEEVVIAVQTPAQPEWEVPGAESTKASRILGYGGDLHAIFEQPPPPPPEAGAPAPRVEARSLAGEKEALPAGVIRARTAEAVAVIELTGLEPPYHSFLGAGELTETVPPGPYRVVFRLGPEAFNETEIYVSAGEELEVRPTLAATPLIREALALREELPATTMVSESIGAMQAGILQTVLPIVAIKPFDLQRQFFRGFDGLVDLVDPEELGLSSFSLVVALDGDWQSRSPEAIPEFFREARAWLMLPGEGREVGLDLTPLKRSTFQGEGRGGGWGLDRIRLAVAPAPAAGGWLELSIPGSETLRLAVTALPRRATVTTLTLHPDGEVDISQNLLRFPGREELYRNELIPDISYGRMVRELQLGQLAYRSGELLPSLEREKQEGSEMAFLLLHAKWTDPILSCMAYFDIARRRAAGILPSPEQFDWILEETARNLERFFPIPDSRVIYGMQFEAHREGVWGELLDTGEIPVLAESARRLASFAEEAGRGTAPVVEAARRIPMEQIWTMSL